MNGSIWNKSPAIWKDCTEMKHSDSDTLAQDLKTLRGNQADIGLEYSHRRAAQVTLASTYILDVDFSQRYAFSLVGTKLNALFLENLKGFSFLDIWQDTDQPWIQQALHSVEFENQTRVLTATALATNMSDVLSVDLLLMPNRDHQNKPRILGSISFATTPHWYGQLPCQHLSLTKIRTLSPPETQQSFEKKNYGHLTVYTNLRAVTQL